jgi:GDP-L-fucose synthase
LRLITGGSGLVGFSIDADLKPSSKELNLLWDTNLIINYLNVNEVDEVIHCAGKIGGVLTNSENQASFLVDNTKMNINILEACRIAGVKKVVCFASTCVFPAKADYPLTVNGMQSGPPHHTNYGYAYSKRLMLEQCKAYKEQYGLNYNVLIPCNIYGPNDNYDLYESHVIPALIHKAYLAKKHGESLRVWGDGAPLREFIYSKDVANIAVKMLDYEGEPIIASPDEEHSIKDAAEIIAEYYNIGEVIYETDKPSGIHRKPSDNSSLKKFIPDMTFTPLKEGLYKAMEWFDINYEDARK